MVDPVCGMEVEAETAAGTAEYRGTTYYFCNPVCVERFNSDPEQYLHPSEARQTPAKCLPNSSEAPVEHHCPMNTDPRLRSL